MTTASNRPDAVAARVNLLEQKVAYLEGGGAGIDPDEYARVRDIVIDKADEALGGAWGNISFPDDGLDRAEFTTVFDTYGGSMYAAVFGPAVTGSYGRVADYLQGTTYYSMYEEFNTRINVLQSQIDALDARVDALEGS